MLSLSDKKSKLAESGEGASSSSAALSLQQQASGFEDEEEEIDIVTVPGQEGELGEPANQDASSERSSPKKRESEEDSAEAVDSDVECLGSKQSSEVQYLGRSKKSSDVMDLTDVD